MLSFPKSSKCLGLCDGEQTSKQSNDDNNNKAQLLTKSRLGEERNYFGFHGTVNSRQKPAKRNCEVTLLAGLHFASFRPLLL